MKRVAVGRRMGLGGFLAAAVVMTSCSAVPKKDADRPTGGENAAKSASAQADGNQRKTSGTGPDAVTDQNTPRGKSATAVPGQDVPDYPDSHDGAKGSPIKAKTKSDADSASK